MATTVYVNEKNELLDVVFNPSPNTMVVSLLDSSDSVIDYDDTATFTVASGGVTHLSAPILFVVPSGTTVSRLTVSYLTAYFGADVIDEDLTNEVFSSNGTYTVSDITVTM